MGAPWVRVPVLSKKTWVTRGERLQSFARPNQDGLLRGPGERRRDGQGSGEAEGAGTGDDEDGERSEAAAGGVAMPGPEDPGAGGEQNHARHEDGGDAGGKALDRRPGGLGLGDQTADARATVLSSAEARTLTVSSPSPFTPPPKTRSPGPTARGRGSPVSAASWTWE